MKQQQTAPISIYNTPKGNEAILASELHSRLGISTPLRTWLPRMLEYGFEHGKDYYQANKNVRKLQGGKRQKVEWVLSLDMAKEIAMIQRTEQGKAIRNYLIGLGNKHASGQLLEPEKCAVLLDLISVMGLASTRKYCERLHYGNRGNPKTWWAYRAKVLGYSAKELQIRCKAIGKRYRNTQQALMELDKLELIRAAVIDFFIGLGKSTEFAQNMGNAAKLFAESITPVFDNDTNGVIDFTTPKQKHIISNLRNNALKTHF